jgi:phosphomannomutase/phosphoglucomutase
MSIPSSIFREYDIRGIYKKELNEQSVKLIGYFLGQRIGKGNVVSIGYDARSHSPILRDYLTSGLNAAGCTVLDMGMVATPVNYFSNYQKIKDLTPKSSIINAPSGNTPGVHQSSINDTMPSASIMITGSHNPSE